MAQLKRCPGCMETYSAEPLEGDFDMSEFGKEIVHLLMEHFISPDGVEYCCDTCWIENGR